MTASPIPRSTQARRHGPTKARRPVGELHGAAPVAHQVNTITVKIEQLPEGRWRFTQPRAPGWVAVAHNPVQVAAALRNAFTEAQVAAHSTWRGHVYDTPDAFEHRRHKPKSRGSRRCDVYDPREWQLRDDGLWQSPGGFKYPEHTQAVQKVMAARRAMGLSARPDPAQPETTISEQGRSA